MATIYKNFKGTPEEVEELFENNSPSIRLKYYSKVGPNEYSLELRVSDYFENKISCIRTIKSLLKI